MYTFNSRIKLNFKLKLFYVLIIIYFSIIFNFQEKWRRKMVEKSCGKVVGNFFSIYMGTVSRAHSWARSQSDGHLCARPIRVGRTVCVRNILMYSKNYKKHANRLSRVLETLC